MRISQITLRNLIATGEWVFIGSQEMDTNFEIILVDNVIRVQASTDDGPLTDEFQEFHSFPEMSDKLDKWVFTLNAVDCTVYF